MNVVRTCAGEVRYRTMVQGNQVTIDQTGQSLSKHRSILQVGFRGKDDCEVVVVLVEHA